MRHSIALLLLQMVFIDGKGVSKKKNEADSFNTRLSDFISEERVPCELPPITHRLPSRIRAKIELIWKDVDSNVTGNCWIEMARTRNILLRLTPEERSAILAPIKECKVPSVVDALPTKFKRKITDIWTKSASKVKGNCWEQQRKTRLLLLNMPLGLKNKFSPPPAFDCALPHFYNRLESTLQEKLKELWKGYEPGTSCVEQIDKQIRLLEANDISLQSFQMPPPAMFKKRDLLKKLRRANVA